MSRETISPRTAIRNSLLAAAITFSGAGCIRITEGPTPSPNILTQSPNTTITFEPNLKSNFPSQTPEITTSLEIEQSGKPNIVVIMLDDINPMDGRLWTKERMPTVNATFVDGGINFKQYYAETPICCPARVGVLTGQHTHNHGVLSNEGYINEFDDSESLATELRETGYFNIIVGKYLNQAQKLDDPTLSAFRKQAIFLMHNGAYYNFLLQVKEGVEGYGDNPSDYSTDVIARKAIDYLYEAPPDKPIFALITPFAAHGSNESRFPIPAPRHIDDPTCQNIEPWQAPGEGNEPFDLIKVCESLLAVDDLVKGVKDELERQGRIGNTIFIFTADQGMAWGKKGFSAKHNPWATNTPLYVSWPDGRGIEERTENSVLSNIDLAPTLAEAAGVEMGPYPNGQKEADGISFYPLLLDQEISPNTENGREYILEHQPIGTLQTSSWAAIRATEASGSNYRLIFYKIGTLALYDLSNDPNQETNLAYLEEYKDKVSKLKGILDYMLKEPNLLLE